MDSPSINFLDVLRCDDFKDNKQALSYILGTSEAGTTVIKNLNAISHLLIAGATGTGKSTLAHAILLSLIENTSPKNLRLLLCDTKVIEFSSYSKVPHLLAPVATGCQMIQGTVLWASKELGRRLQLISTANCHSIDAYNKHLHAECSDELPHILLAIDDIVSALYDNAAWDALQLLAQSGRIAGIHLLLVTQTPSNKKLASIIKSSISARAAFNVFTNSDEKLLLGSTKNAFVSDIGEIIFCTMPSKAKERIKCFQIVDSDISAVLASVKERYPAVPPHITISAYPFVSTLSSDLSELNEDLPEFDDNLTELIEGNELLPDAVEVILETGQASVSMVQRRLKLGYARAARLLDEMEEKGIVGPFVGSNPRKILITKEQWAIMKGEDSPEQLAFDNIEEPNSSENMNLSDLPDVAAISETSRKKQEKRTWLSSFADLFIKKETATAASNTITETLAISTDAQLAEFKKAHPLIDEVHTKVVGVTFSNVDGTSRQLNLSRCHDGDEVTFQPFKYKGEPALSVHTKCGQIGNLSADLAAQFEYDYGCDLILSGVITEITGGSDGKYYGCNLLIRAYRA